MSEAATISVTPASATPTAQPQALTQPPAAPPVQPTDAQAAPPEATKPAEGTQPEKKELASSRFAALAKKEARLQAEREALKAEREGLTPVQKQVADFEEAKKNAKLNPLKALEMLGVSINDVNEFFLNGSQPTQDAKLSEVDRKIEEFKAEQRAEKERIATEAKAAIEAEQAKVMEDFRADVHKYIEGEPEKFELTNLFGSQAECVQLIELHYERTGEVMSKETAAELVERELEDLAKKAIGAKRFQAKAPPQPEEANKQAPKSASHSNRTISATLTPTSQPMARPISAAASSDAERLAAAVAKYHELARN